MDNFFGSLLINSNPQLKPIKPNDWEDISRDLKEKYCYLTAPQGCNQQAKTPITYSLPDGQKLKIYDEQRIKAPEALFFHGVGLSKAIIMAATGYTVAHAEDSFNRLLNMKW